MSEIRITPAVQVATLLGLAGAIAAAVVVQGAGAAPLPEDPIDMKPPAAM
jgi:hypothetical protein